MESVKYVLEYTSEMDEGEWFEFRILDDLEDAVAELGIETRRHTHLQHRLKRVKTRSAVLLTINEQGD
jgi:hypothetical protein